MSSKSTVNNFFWKFSERITAQVVTLVVSIILARILEPSHYGIISIVTIFITLANVLVSDGFGSALIQKKDADALDFYSVLYFNIVLSIVLYIILFMAAPFIANFYGDGYEILTPVLRVLGIRIIISGINSVQQAYVSRKMIFKKFFIATSFGTVLSAVVGIYMAYKGFGVWALVAQYLTNTTVDTLVLNRTLKLKPRIMFSFNRLKKLIPYGVGILGTKLLITGYQELRALLIGKVYTSADLAYYDKGRQFPKLIVTNIDTSIGSVLFPKMSKQQDDPLQIKQFTRKSIRYSSYLMCPMMLGLAAVADSFVKIILTDKWLPCVGLMRVFCIIYLFQPIHTANMQAIKAIGRSDVYFKLELFKKVIELIALFISIRISVNAIAVSTALLTTSYTIVNAFPNRKLLNYPYKEQFVDIMPNVCMSLVMLIAVIGIGKVISGIYVKVMVQILVGVGIYLLLSLITKNEVLFYIFDMIKRKTLHGKK